jgi:hypothetical protein
MIALPVSIILSFISYMRSTSLETGLQPSLLACAPSCSLFSVQGV